MITHWRFSSGKGDINIEAYPSEGMVMLTGSMASGVWMTPERTREVAKALVLCAELVEEKACGGRA